MTFRKLLIIMTFVVTAVIIMLLSTSYAWYQFDNAVTSFNNVNTFDGDIDLAVVFTNTNNINTTVGIPLLTSEVEEYSNKNTFTITPSSSTIAGREVAYQISLIDIKIDSELTEVDTLRYQLLETINGVTTTVKDGNFEHFTDGSLILKNMTEITEFDTTYSYEFRIWLADNGCTLEQVSEGVCQNQNDLMGKKITGKIKVSTVLR